MRRASARCGRPPQPGNTAGTDRGARTACPRGDGGTPPEVLLQTHLKDSRVVKAFNTIFFQHLATLGRPAGAPDRSALPIAGDDAAARTAVAALIDSLGYDTYDAGALAECRRFAPGTPARHAYLDPEGMFAAPGRPASADDIAGLLASIR